jgi:hypothetical protein
MGILVIGGLLSSTLLTLVVVPTVYTLAEDATAWGVRAVAAVRSALRSGDVADRESSLLDSPLARKEDT